MGKFLFDCFCQKRIKKDFWRCFRRLKRPQKERLQRLSIWGAILDFSKVVNPWFWLKIIKFFFFNVFGQNKIRKDVWRCFRRLKYRNNWLSFLGCHTGLGLTHDFESKLELEGFSLIVFFLKIEEGKMVDDVLDG